jgi:hypothetical protein
MRFLDIPSGTSSNISIRVNNLTCKGTGGLQSSRTQVNPTSHFIDTFKHCMINISTQHLKFGTQMKQLSKLGDNQEREC